MRGIIAILIFIGVTVVAGYGGAKLRIDTSARTVFRDDDPYFAKYRRFTEEFGGDELVVVAYRVPKEWGDAFSLRNLLLLDRITCRLGEIDGVLEAMSLTSAVNFVARNRRIRLVRLFKRKEGKLLVPEGEELERLRREVLDNPIFSGNIVSRDGRAVAVVCRIETRPEQAGFKRSLVASIRETLKDAPPNVKFYMAGPAVADIALQDALLCDLYLFLPLLVLILAGLLFYIFRDIRPVVLSILTIGASVVWTGGLIKVTSGVITLATVAVPPIVLAVGVAFVVHFISSYREHRESLGRLDAVRAARKTVASPCFFAALTTAMGFLSLSVVDVPAVREMGFFCAFAVMAGVAVTLLFVPEVVLLWKRRKRRPSHKLIRLFLTLFVRSRSWRVFVSVLIISGLVIAAVGISRIRVETSLLEYFWRDDPVRVAHKFVADNFGGVATVNILITDPKDIFRVETIKRVTRLQKWLSAQKEVGQVLSIADILTCMNYALLGERRPLVEPIEPLLAQHREALRRFRLHRSGERGRGGALAALVSDDLRTMRISIRLREWSSRVLAPFMECLEAKVEEVFPKDGVYRAEVVGASALFLRVASRLVEGEKKGLLAAFLAVLVTVFLTMRSFRLGAVAMLPTSLPVFAALGLMGFLDVPVNVSTSMVPSVALGILVDNAIHYIWRSKYERRRGSRNPSFTALLSVGRPLTFNTIIISAGFAVLIVSSFRTNRFLGAFTAFALVFGLLCTFIFLPPLVRRCLKNHNDSHHAGDAYAKKDEEAQRGRQ